MLVATDFSEGSDEALAQAIDLGKQTGASIELLYVLEPAAEQLPFGPIFHWEEITARADRELALRAERARAAGLSCHTRWVEGRASLDIVRHAREVGAHFIVIGTLGRRGFAHTMLGSVAERVVQHASCPVLIVPFSKKAA